MGIASRKSPRDDDGGEAVSSVSLSLSLPLVLVAFGFGDRGVNSDEPRRAHGVEDVHGEGGRAVKEDEEKEERQEVEEELRRGGERARGGGGGKRRRGKPSVGV